MAEFKRTTRVKRDYPLFRERLRSCIEESGMTQVEASKAVSMDVRTFNHVVAGPTHPDLQLLRDVGDKLKLNLNYLFGLSSQKQPAPDDFDPTTFLTMPFIESYDGHPFHRWEWEKGPDAQTCAYPRRSFLRLIDTHGTTATNTYSVAIKESDCDQFLTGNPIGFFKVQDYVSKKQVYSIGIQGKHYIRYVEQRLGEEMYNIATDTLMQNAVQMNPNEVEIYGILIRIAKDA